MNMSLDNDSLVQMVNDEKVKVLLPCIVYIAILMASGLVGNMMVVYYYGFKTKMVTPSLLIVTLAIYDLIFCSITMPTEIVDIVRFYTFKNGTACKILYCISYVAAIASNITLVTIAIDRFKQLCRTTGKQMKVGDAKKYCIIVASGSVLVSLPSLFILDSEQVPVENEYGVALTGYTCRFVKSKSYKPYVWTFNVVVMLGFIVCTVVLTVLYGMIVWTIYKHKKGLARYRLDVSKTSEIQLSSTNNATKLGASEEAHHDLGTSVTTIEFTTEMGNKAIHTHSKSMTSKTEVDTGSVNKTHNDTIRVTRVMFAITMVFVISYLPYLSLEIWKGITGKHKGDISDAGLVGYAIGLRSCLLNSSVNPWIYGIFNSRFRLYYYKLLFCKNKD